jgi:fatty acid/phospholipid biosynthesis enzyme
MLIVKKDSRKIRLALASEFPNSEKPISLWLDMWWNLSADPWHNLDYALLAKSYLLERYWIDVPVSLISITTEKGKWYPQDEESYQLLSDADIKGLISFDGYIEPDGILKWARKIIVGDARSMNLSLKWIKWGASYVISKIPLLHYIQWMFNKSWWALLLWAKKPIWKANGNSSAKTISIALEELFHFMKLEANTNIISKITARYEDLLERSKQKEEA